MPHLIRRKLTQKLAAPQEWQTHLQMADDHYRAAEQALQKNSWHQAGLASLHIITAMAEALLTCQGGIRTASESPGELIYLLTHHLPHTDLADLMPRLLDAMDCKTLARFEDRTFTAEESHRCFSHADQFYRWSRKWLPNATT